MLHSDQSFPGTPDWPGSRTGIGPVGRQMNNKSVRDEKRQTVTENACGERLLRERKSKN